MPLALDSEHPDLYVVKGKLGVHPFLSPINHSPPYLSVMSRILVQGSRYYPKPRT